MNSNILRLPNPAILVNTIALQEAKTSTAIENTFSQPYAKPDIIGDRLGKSSRTTLTRYMEALAQQRILVPKKDGRSIYYLNEDLIRILEG